MKTFTMIQETLKTRTIDLGIAKFMMKSKTLKTRSLAALPSSNLVKEDEYTGYKLIASHHIKRLTMARSNLCEWYENMRWSLSTLPKQNFMNEEAWMYWVFKIINQYSRCTPMKFIISLLKGSLVVNVSRRWHETLLCGVQCWIVGWKTRHPSFVGNVTS